MLQRGILICNHVHNVVPMLKNNDIDVQLGLYTDDELLLPSTVSHNVTMACDPATEQLRQPDVSDTSQLEGVNLLDVMDNTFHHMRYETNIIPSAPPLKQELSVSPNKGGESERCSKNTIIFTEHKIVDDNNNNILCRAKRGRRNKIHLPTTLTFSVPNYLELFLTPSEGEEAHTKIY